MNKHERARRVIILTGTRAQAVRKAESLGIDPKRVLWPRSRGDLAGCNALPLYVDISLEGHPDEEALADYVAMRWKGTRGLYAPNGSLDNVPSLVVD